MHKILLPALFALLSTTAYAAPSLRSEVSVNRPVITVGDMFADAGLLAEKALFRAPLPGTTGIVSLDAIRTAAARAGLLDYTQEGILSVRVERQATVIDTAALTALIRADLESRGLVAAGVDVEARFETPDLSFNAENVPVPAILATLQYQPGAAGFTARFNIAGLDLPVDVRGRLDLMVEAPHLATSLKAGDIITPADIEMKRVPLDFADRSGIHSLDQLVGKQLRRTSRAGVMLKVGDITEPLAVHRNSQVSVLLRNGPMTLTVIGQSLGDAVAGQPVQVMNTVTRKILNGVASANGSVEITTASSQLKLAGL